MPSPERDTRVSSAGGEAPRLYDADGSRNEEVEQLLQNYSRTLDGPQSAGEGLDPSSRQAHMALVLLLGAVQYEKPTPAHFEAPERFASGQLWAKVNSDARHGDTD